MLGNGLVQFLQVHGDHGFDGRVQFGKFQLHPLDDEAMVVRQ